MNVIANKAVDADKKLKRLQNKANKAKKLDINRIIVNKILNQFVNN